MSINGLVLKKAATSMAVTGGTDMTFTDDKSVVSGGVHVINTAEADWRVRQHATVKYRPPKPLGNGKYSRETWSGTIVLPAVETDGSIVNETFRYELQLRPGSTLNLDLRLLAAQFLSQAATSAYFTSGSLS